MATSANVSLSENESELLTLNMSRKVLRIDNVSITNIPEYVTDVNVTIIPLGENLKVNGEIEGKNGAEVIALKKDTQQKIWQSTESRYCLASNSKATVKVALTRERNSLSHTLATRRCNPTIYLIYLVNLLQTKYSSKEQ